MKKFYLYSALFLLFAVLSNCTTSKIIEEQNPTRGMGIIPDTLHMVVKYRAGMNADDKKAFREKNKFKANDTTHCECGETDIEFLSWDYDKYSAPEIQSARNNLKEDGDAQSDEHFTMSIYPLTKGSDSYTTILLDTIKQNPDTIISRYLNDKVSDIPLTDSASGITDRTVNIAIIDTGLDVREFNALGSFLYPTKNLTEGCDSQQSGWNFAGNNTNIFDDHGHGNQVMWILSRKLKKANVPFRILPIKVFNIEGKARYWDMICAMNYVNQINKNTDQKIEIVNASFGYGFTGLDLTPEDMDLYKEQSIFKSLIDDLNETTLVSASAGNVDYNIDSVVESNFPASFISGNLIGVGGYLLENGNLEAAGNFGPNSLDVAAKYRFEFPKHLIFKEINQGSSFSTAYTTAILAELIFELKGDAQNPGYNPNAAKTLFLGDEPNHWVDYNSSQLGGKINLGRFISKE